MGKSRVSLQAGVGPPLASGLGGTEDSAVWVGCTLSHQYVQLLDRPTRKRSWGSLQDKAHGLADFERAALTGAEPGRTAGQIFGGFDVRDPVLVVNRGDPPRSAAEKNDCGIAGVPRMLPLEQRRTSGGKQRFTVSPTPLRCLADHA